MKAPVVIIGGGPSGAASAMFLARLGVETLIVEKERFPRYHIGESMSGECGGIVRLLGLEQQMIKRKYPVKRGVNVYGPAGTYAWRVNVAARDKDWNLVPQTTWQVRRADFDKMLLDEAVARGAKLIPGEALRPIVGDDGTVRGVTVRAADGGTFDIESEIVLDCSGQQTFLANAGVTGPKYRGNYDKQIAIFSQVANAIRDEGPTQDDSQIFYQKKYHWSWFIPIDSEIVSVATIIPAAYFKDKKESKADFLRRELHEMNPEIKRRIPEVKLVEETRSIPNYSYQVRHFCGKGFICIGDAHRFIDPIFSFGLYVSVFEAMRSAQVTKEYLNGKGRDDTNPFADYQMTVEQGIDILEDMMDTFWEYPLAFARMAYVVHKDLVTDIFAGRLWDHQPSTAVTDMRKLLKRERTYSLDQEDYSVPIGSRYHPERAPIWQMQEPT
jgi:1H-pyrrole-2-carbonyl-[peptidyl-carrier protein] brominase